MTYNVKANTTAEIQEFDDRVKRVEKEKGQVAQIARALLAISSKRNKFVAENIDDMTSVSKSTVYVAIKVAQSMNLIEHVDDNEDTYGRNAKIYAPVN